MLKKVMLKTVKARGKSAFWRSKSENAANISEIRKLLW
jgi:hypothetical protein